MRATLKELAERSDAIVYGSVTKIEARSDKDGMPWTFYTLAVSDVFAGEIEGKEFTFRCADGRAVEVSGMPRLRQNQSTVVFFREDGGFCQVQGLFQGALRILDTPSGIPALVDGYGRGIVGFSDRDLVVTDFVAERLSDAQLLEPQPAPDAASANIVDVAPLDAGILLSELKLFATAFASRARKVASTTDLNGAFSFTNTEVVVPVERPPARRCPSETRYHGAGSFWDGDVGKPLSSRGGLVLLQWHAAHPLGTHGRPPRPDRARHEKPDTRGSLSGSLHRSRRTSIQTTAPR